MNHLDANRRAFLKKAGLGSMALVASQLLSPMLATPVMADDDDDDDDDERMGFHFVCLSDGGVDSEEVHHQLIMAGTGKFDNEHVEGGGFFNHSDAASGVPNTLLGTGTWQAKRLISFTLLDHPENPFGFVASGILVVDVRLIPESGPHIPATLKVICNIPPIGAFTGLPEGYFLDVEGGLSFAPTSFPGTSFPVGITVFSVGNGRD